MLISSVLMLRCEDGWEVGEQHEMRDRQLEVGSEGT